MRLFLPVLPRAWRHSTSWSPDCLVSGRAQHFGDDLITIQCQPMISTTISVSKLDDVLIDIPNAFVILSAPTYDAIPQYAITLSVSVYSLGSSPRKTAKPMPSCSCVLICPRRSASTCGRGNVSGLRCGSSLPSA